MKEPLLGFWSDRLSMWPFHWSGTIPPVVVTQLDHVIILFVDSEHFVEKPSNAHQLLRPFVARVQVEDETRRLALTSAAPRRSEVSSPCSVLQVPCAAVHQPMARRHVVVASALAENRLAVVA